MQASSAVKVHRRAHLFVPSALMQELVLRLARAVRLGLMLQLGRQVARFAPLALSAALGLRRAHNA
jgi:hypothetical protein